jgi:glucosyl-3-phosphoglycerate synthase
LNQIVATEKNDFSRTKAIAKLLEGKTFAELIHVVESIPLIGDSVQVIRELQSRGYICGIISDSYHCITNHVKNMLGLDFTLSNRLEFRKSVATGEVTVPDQFRNDPKSICVHDHCKSNMLLHILNHFRIGIHDSIAVGDGENDLCMIKAAGTGISFNSTHHPVDDVADHIFRDGSLKPVLDVTSGK